MRRGIILAVIAVLVIGLVPALATAQVSDETIAALAELETAVDGLGGDTVEDWVTSAAAVGVAVESLRGIAGDELDFAAFDAALAGLDAAIVGGDLDEIAAAAVVLEGEMAALAAQAEQPAATTTTAAPAATTTAAPAATTTTAPAGGVATGAGGTADTNAFPISVLVGAGFVSLLLAGLYTRGRRSEG
jgi:cell division septation protein DedD